MIYNQKFIFDFSPIPGTEYLKYLQFPVLRKIKVIFKEDSGKVLYLGTG